MTLTMEQPRRHGGRMEPGAARVGWTHHPLRAAGNGLLIVILGAWAGLVTFIGPTFGFTPTSSSSWQWTTNNWLLHLLPGAAGVVGGLLILGSAPTLRARALTWLAVLLIVAAGAWLVIGPAAWPLFESSSVYATASTSWRDFLNQIGTNLGPGLLLAVLGGMALKAGAGTAVSPAAVTPAPVAPVSESDRAPVSEGQRAGAPTTTTGRPVGAEGPVDPVD
jgi:hypothetical protein